VYILVYTRLYSFILVYTPITDDQNVSNKISHMTHNKIENTQFFFSKHTGAVTKGQQTSDNFHRPMLHRHKKPVNQ